MPTLTSVIESAAVPALRMVATLAVLVFACAGSLIYRRRHQFFDEDPEVDEDTPVARHTRFELVIFVWSGLMLVVLGILYQVWRA